MDTRKICLLGDVGVGKTCVVSRYAGATLPRPRFRTSSLKVDSRHIQLASGESRRLLLWEIAKAVVPDGECSNYLQGTQGFVLVADGTRSGTVQYAIGQWRRAQAALSADIPAVMLLNKCDMSGRWTMSTGFVERVDRYLPVFITSARTGESIAAAFAHIGELA